MPNHSVILEEDEVDHTCLIYIEKKSFFTQPLMPQETNGYFTVTGANDKGSLVGDVSVTTGEWLDLTLARRRAG